MLATNTHVGLLSGPDDLSDDELDELISKAEVDIDKEDMARIPKAVAGDKTAQMMLESTASPKVKEAYKKALEAKLKAAKTEKEKSEVVAAIKSAGKAGLKFGTAVLSTVNKLSAELAAAKGKAGTGSTTTTTTTDNTMLYIALGIALIAIFGFTKKG